MKRTSPSMTLSAKLATLPLALFLGTAACDDDDYSEPDGRRVDDGQALEDEQPGEGDDVGATEAPGIPEAPETPEASDTVGDTGLDDDMDAGEEAGPLGDAGSPTQGKGDVKQDDVKQDDVKQDDIGQGSSPDEPITDTPVEGDQPSMDEAVARESFEQLIDVKIQLERDEIPEEQAREMLMTAIPAHLEAEGLTVDQAVVEQIVDQILSQAIEGLADMDEAALRNEAATMINEALSVAGDDGHAHAMPSEPTPTP